MTSIRHLLNYMVLKQFTDKLKYIRDMSSSILLPSGRMSSIKSFIGHYAVSGHKVIKNIASNHELLI